jgi:hypothetical protein
MSPSAGLMATWAGCHWLAAVPSISSLHLGLAEGGAAEEREACGTDVKQWQAQMAYRAWRVEG